MTSTMTRERMLMPPSNELDSECSSGGGDDNHHSHSHHHQVDLRRRLQTDDMLDLSSPKKRRKQTTPVRVPATLITTGDQMPSEEEDDDNDDDGLEEDMDDLEGEIAATAHGNHIKRESDDEFIEKGKTSTLVSDQGMSKDENLNTEFRCLLCGSLFEDNDTLLRHRESEHGISDLARQSINQSPLSQNSLLPVAVKIEQDESSDNPVNLSSGFSLKNFTNAWLTGTTQMQESDWSGQNPMMISGQLSCLPYPGALTQYLPLPTFPMAETGQLPRNVVGGSAPIRIFNPDAYCELCNKEFCNKYFLKTHKANKHGIYLDQPASSTPGANDNGLLSYPNQLFPAVNVKVEQPQLQLSQQQKLEVPEISPLSMMPTVPCDICQKRFKNEESLKKHKQKVHIEQISDHTDSQSLPATGLGEDDCKEMPSLRASPSNIEALFKQEYGIEQEDAKFMPPPRQLSPQLCQQVRECGFTGDKLRALGVINPDAFCEICCKEYCNKHFLRIHKIKRHGILMQSNGKSPSNPGAAVSWHQIQTSPLNLIVSDAPADSESTDKSEDYECKPCGIRFQTMGLYEIHKSKNHDNEELKSPIPGIDTEEIDNDQRRPDTISQDLQKLQTMILQLNGLKPGNRPIVCGICSRECESKLALKTHMSLEHGTNILEESLSPSQPMIDSSFLAASSTFCTLCEKDFRTPESLKQHLAEDHSHNQTISTPNNLTNATQISTPVPTNQLSGPPIPPPADKKLSSMTPTSSYCEICNKELCNKYFMKTHMQRMHGIEIENGSQIGGVVCNICNKELCSKYFLRVHKHNTHGIVDEGSVGGTTAASMIKPDSFESSNSEDIGALKSNDHLGDLSNRYFTHFTEVCPVCSRRFRSIKWLKAHLLGDHGKAGVDKWRELEQQYQQNPTAGTKKLPANPLMNRPVQPSPNLKIPNGFDVAHHLKPSDYGTTLGKQVLSTLFGGVEEQTKNYRCSYCNFTTPVLPFLFLHERSHVASDNMSMEQSLQCPICSQAFTQPEMLHHHLMTRHQVGGMQFPSPITANPSNPSAANLSALEASQIEREIADQKDFSEVIDENNKHINAFPSQTNFDAIKGKRDDANLTAGAVGPTTATATILVTPQAAYKCAQCGLATTNLNRIKKHVKKDHKSIGDPTDNVIAELTKTLRDVANKHKVPVSYAIPQDTNSSPDTGTIMQPFLIEEKDCGFSSDDSRSEKKFSPVLIYLPVRTRVTGVLTTSFTLSPA